MISTYDGTHVRDFILTCCMLQAIFYAICNKINSHPFQINLYFGGLFDCLTLQIIIISINNSFEYLNCIALYEPYNMVHGL